MLEAPLLGWIPYSIFGNWISRLWGILSVYFYVKWLMQIKKWNDAFETKSDQTVARIFHPLMAPAMGSVVVMEVVTFAGASVGKSRPSSRQDAIASVRLREVRSKLNMQRTVVSENNQLIPWSLGAVPQLHLFNLFPSPSLATMTA